MVLTLACDPFHGESKAPARPLVSALRDKPAAGLHYAKSPWPTIHRDSRNSDYAPIGVSPNVQVNWTALEGAALLVGPIIGSNGQLYITSGRGRGHSHLHAFNREGEALWETKPMETLADFDHTAIVSAPIVDTENHIFAADSNQLWSFTSQGDVRWTVHLPDYGIKGFFVTPIFNHQGKVGGVSTDGKVAFFERETGELAYPILNLPSRPGPASQPPPPGLWEGGLVAPEFIRPLWDLTYGRGLKVSNTPAVHPETGRIFVTAGGQNANQGVLYGLDPHDRGVDIAFQTSMGQGSGASPAISPDGNRVYAVDDDGKMTAMDTLTGEPIWEIENTMGQASPSIGPDGTIYSFAGLAGTIVAVDGVTGQIKWKRQYNHLARSHLTWIPFLDRITTVDGLITVTDSGLFAFFDLNYELRGGDQPYPQPRQVRVGQIDSETGKILASFSSPDTSSAFLVPDLDGRSYLSLSGAASSIAYYGVNPKLPRFLRVKDKPVAGLVALRTRDGS